MKTTITPADVAGDYSLSDAEETLVILLLRHADADAEAMAHQVWREAGNADRPTWEISVLIGRRYGMEGCL